MITVFLLLTAGLNLFLVGAKDRNDGIYRVEAGRLAGEIAETGSYDLKKYPHLTGVFTGDGLYRSDEHYLIIEVGETLYRVEYTVGDRQYGIVAVNCVLGVLFLLVTGLLYYIHRHIITPFDRLSDVPKELARGNLAVPIPEEKSRFFGKFTWGVNLLRESIEDSRKKEITMQRDKKLAAFPFPRHQNAFVGDQAQCKGACQGIVQGRGKTTCCRFEHLYPCR